MIQVAYTRSTLRLASLCVFCNLWLACFERFLPCYYYICQSCTLGSWKLEACYYLVILHNACQSFDLAVLV
ncbi:hypothetical protein JB92DRAFT_1157916 [Gautieria morchelliformis]|nr:hypothetical protein JB92DRAFT_1157916 [Gautieria morchelliformis]